MRSGNYEGVATIKEIKAQGWSLNPGRHVGVAERDAGDFGFYERLQELNEELKILNTRCAGVGGENCG